MTTAAELRTSMQKVAEILKESERARDDDKYLWLVYLFRYTNFRKSDLHSPEAFAKRVLEHDIPSSDTISRCRRKIQEGGLYWGEKRKARMNNAVAISDWAING